MALENQVMKPECRISLVSRSRFPKGVELVFTASTTPKIDDVTQHNSMTERTDVGGVIARRERHR
jgi:hypothetical protein